MPVLDKFISQKMLVGCRIESVPYTAESAVEYDILAKNVQVSPEIEQYLRKYAVGDFDSFEAVPGKRMGEITFTVDFQGSGTATAAPKIGKLLKGCAFRETVGGFGVLYTKDSNNNAVPLTFEITFKGTGISPSGIKVKLRGCMGDVEILVAKTGEPIQGNFRMMGALTSITDITAATLPGLTGHDTTNPPATLSAALKLFTQDNNANNISIKMNNDVQMHPDLGQGEGYEGAYTVDATPSVNLDPYLAKESDRFLWQRATGQTGTLSGRLQMWAGSTAVLGNHIQVDAFQAQVLKSHNIASREGTDMNPIELQLNRGSTGAPIFQICFGSYTGIAGY